jgi:hypothetical protein
MESPFPYSTYEVCPPCRIKVAKSLIREPSHYRQVQTPSADGSSTLEAYPRQVSGGFKASPASLAQGRVGLGCSGDLSGPRGLWIGATCSQIRGQTGAILLDVGDVDSK